MHTRRWRLNRRSLWMLIALAVILLVYPFVFQQPFPQHIAIMVFLFAAAAQAWNILGGYAGQLSIGHAIYFGLGAYTSTLLLREYGISPWVGMAAGALLAVLVALLIGLPTFRITGLYYAIATLELGVIFKDLFINWRAVGGAVGILFPILPESFVNFQFRSSKLPYYYIALVLVAVVFLVAWLIERRPLGYFLRAIRDEPEAAAMLGVNLTKYKLTAAALSAFFTSIVGTFYAQYLLFINPDSVFAIQLSILIALTAVLGGTGAFWGPALGALILVPLSELSRSFFGGQGDAANLVIYGSLIVLVAVWQPRGIAGLIERIWARGRMEEGELPRETTDSES